MLSENIDLIRPIAAVIESAVFIALSGRFIVRYLQCSRHLLPRCDFYGDSLQMYDCVMIIMDYGVQSQVTY